MPELGEFPSLVAQSNLVDRDLQFADGNETATGIQSSDGIDPMLFETGEAQQVGILQSARIAMRGLAETVGQTIGKATGAMGDRYKGGLAFAVGSMIAVVAPAAVADNTQQESRGNGVVPAHIDSHRAKSNSTCPPGHLKLSLAGPTTVNANQSAHYVLDVQDCKTPRPTTMKNVQIQESVTGPILPKNWTIRKIRDGATVHEGFNVTMPGNPTAFSGPPSTNQETFSYLATKGSKDLGVGSTNINVVSPPGNLLSNIAPTLPTNPTPGVYVAGPTTVELNTPYTYTVEVDEAQTYQNVRISYNVPSSSMNVPLSIPEIVANTPWIKTFTTKFVTPGELNTTGIEVQVGYLRPNIGYKQLTDNKYPVTLAPGANNSVTSPNTAP